MGSPIMERSIRRLLFLGWGFSTTQQPSLCQKSLMLAVVAASVPPGLGHSMGTPVPARERLPGPVSGSQPHAWLASPGPGPAAGVRLAAAPSVARECNADP